MHCHQLFMLALVQAGLLTVLGPTQVSLAEAQENGVAAADEAQLAADSSTQHSRLGRPSKEGFYIKLLPEEEKLMEALRTKRYEFGWSGGISNELEDKKKQFAAITPIRIETTNRYVILSYPLENGVLHGRIKGRKMAGDWIQDNDTGRFSLKFSDDMEVAIGWWHDDWQLGSDGEPIKHRAYMKTVSE